ncbi:MAG: winged helix-turn-helix transcriptional regulator [Alphaproteobacteria bacterium]|nr:winged helix-turn-helix transcriptional regulator [Alphaproteobacteria bacterium]
MNNQDMIKATKVLKAVANEKRLKILYNIKDKELSVGEIEKLVNLSQSALSQHLAILRADDIVKTRRKAQTIFYQLKDEKTKSVLKLLDDLF